MVLRRVLRVWPKGEAPVIDDYVQPPETVPESMIDPTVDPDTGEAVGVFEPGKQNNGGINFVGIGESAGSSESTADAGARKCPPHRYMTPKVNVAKLKCQTCSKETSLKWVAGRPDIAENIIASRNKLPGDQSAWIHTFLSVVNQIRKRNGRKPIDV